MSREIWKPGNMLYPVPAVLVTCRSCQGEDNVFTVAWTGTICSDPVMVSISVRKERHSYQMIKETGEFIINLTTKELVRAVDYCGVKSGRDTDKWKDMGLKKTEGSKVNVAAIQESPVFMECVVKDCIELGSHDMFLANVLAVSVDNKYMDEHNKFCLSQAEPIVYSHGEYYALGEKLGTFGYSVKKK